MLILGQHLICLFNLTTFPIIPLKIKNNGHIFTVFGIVYYRVYAKQVVSVNLPLSFEMKNVMKISKFDGRNLITSGLYLLL